ncbi:DUF2855 family protein [Nitratireductor mangrovi]|uniref:DUF2855 family protein n=1 Tax=Nitratireductor mangrovi TaxID=2599600 RepID=A0A5B8KWT1_9HYPH|nr:DUF2855 family protein [Nitratireductor mangrovi]QDZ00134.1 DUF2855 family protein [Nitratireductor mangrovi]
MDKATASIARIETNKNDLGNIRVISGPAPAAAGDGEVVLRLDRFALTTNNITYAALGDAPGLTYWQFFPTDHEGWGHMPVWGFADIVSSGVEGIEVGERFYGYFPIAEMLRMHPIRVSPRGFYDGAEHRQGLVSAYNQYQRCSTDAAYVADREALQVILRPLFITSFVLDDYLRDNDFFGAEQIVVSSASAKTAFGAAFCMKANGAPHRIGLTSAANRDFVTGLGFYGSTAVYEEIEQLDASVPTIYVDFAGKDTLRQRMHARFGGKLVHDCLVGATRTSTFDATTARDGGPTFFFAPNQIRKRNADWGAAEMTRRFNEMQIAFFTHLATSGAGALVVEDHRGAEAAAQVIRTLTAGSSDPRSGHVVSMG